jgi:GxxExxY protein
MPVVSWDDEDNKSMGDEQDEEARRLQLEKIIQDIRAAANTVMLHLGVGYSESVYQSALECELRLRHIQYEQQPIVNIFYKGTKVGYHKPDLIVERSIIVELKAFGSKATGKYQLKRYMHQIRHDPHAKRKNDQLYGMLINFCDNPVSVQVFE